MRLHVDREVMPVLTGLEVYRFRGIKELKLHGLTHVNVLLGRNDVGKSSVLEALYLASAAFRFEDPLNRGDKVSYLLNRRGARGLRWRKGGEVLWYGYDDSESIKLALKIDNKAIRIELHRSHEHPLVALEPEEPMLGCLCCAHVFDERGWMHGARSIGEMRGKINKLVPGLIDIIEGMMFIDAPLLRDFRRVEDTLWTPLIRDRLDKLVVETLKSGYSIPIEDLTYARFGEDVQLMARLPHTSVRVDDLGDGARYALAMLMAAALAKNTILLIEEPESHQHPGGLAKAVEMLLDVAKKNGTQLFISTHSIELVRLLEAVGREVGLEIATFFLERDENGLVSARRVEPGDREILAKLGIDVRFLDII